MATEEFSGPVDYVVFAFEGGSDVSAGLVALLERVQDGIVEVLDIEVVSLDDNGRPVRGTLAELMETSDQEFDLGVFAGVESNILDDEDFEVIAGDLFGDQFALVVVYEDRSLAGVAAAWRTASGTELFSGGIDIADLEHALDEGAPA